jgi:acyl-CoA synthetase (AMP-forming)/AMP-acid ligase II
VFSGGSVLTDSLGDRIRARVCSNVTKGYGSTEAGEVASMPSHFAKGTVGAVGFVMPAVSVETVDSSDRSLPAGSEGIVRVRSEVSAREYLSDPEETKRVFRDGWFYPGDLGYLTPDNMLVVSGRVSSVINIGGEKANPERIEEVLATHATVAQAAVLSVPGPAGVDEMCALIVPRTQLDAEALRAYCTSSLPAAFVPARFIAVRELPRNEWGKLERTKLREVLNRTLN